ncbi:MAG: electron transport complex subunit E [Gammaproteobacteria bacterium]|nr:electron transport complex subunit E [Gammaproteobacteria bacterium]
MSCQDETPKPAAAAGPNHSSLWLQGLWQSNPILVQGLALCPVVAMSSSATNAMALGVLTTAVMLASNLLISAMRHLIADSVRIPVFILLIATLVTIVDLLLNAYAHGLHQVLGLFIPLIVTNCIILGRAEAAARKMPVAAAASDGLAQGLGFTAVITALGIARELVATGRIFADAPQMLGVAGEWLSITLLPDYPGLLLARLPPGGFIALGLMLVIYRMLKQAAARRQQRQALNAEVSHAG